MRRFEIIQAKLPFVYWNFWINFFAGVANAGPLSDDVISRCLRAATAAFIKNVLVDVIAGGRFHNSGSDTKTALRSGVEPLAQFR